jgi:hypothetical protein
MSKSKAAKIVKMHQEIEQLRSAANDDKLDAERWRYARQHSYIEVRCDSPRVDGWKVEHLDQAIDEARAALTPKGRPISKSTATEGQWTGEDAAQDSKGGLTVDQVIDELGIRSEVDQIKTDKADRPSRVACTNVAHMGEFACANRHQCFEPCGELGHDAKYAQRAPNGPLDTILDQRLPQAEADKKSACTLTDAELADPEFVRADIEGCNDSFITAMEEVVLLRAALAAVPGNGERKRLDRAHQSFLDGMKMIGLGDGTKGWIEHADHDEPLRRDPFSLEGEIFFGFETIKDHIESLKAMPP